MFINSVTTLTHSERGESFFCICNYRFKNKLVFACCYLYQIVKMHIHGFHIRFVVGGQVGLGIIKIHTILCSHSACFVYAGIVVNAIYPYFWRAYCVVFGNGYFGQIYRNNGQIIIIVSPIVRQKTITR